MNSNIQNPNKTQENSRRNSSPSTPEKKSKKKKFVRLSGEELTKHTAFVENDSPRSTPQTSTTPMTSTPEKPQEPNRQLRSTDFKTRYNGNQHEVSRTNFSYRPQIPSQNFNRSYNLSFRPNNSQPFQNYRPGGRSQNSNRQEVVYQPRNQRSISRGRRDSSVDSNPGSRVPKSNRFEENYFKLGSIASDDSEIFAKLVKFFEDLEESIPAYKAHREKIDKTEEDIKLNKQEIAKNRHAEDKRKALSEKLKELVCQKKVFDAFIKGKKAEFIKLEEIYRDAIRRTSKEYRQRQIALATFLRSIDVEIFRLSSALPIYSKKDLLMEHIENNNVTLFVAGTGTGKSTQLPQYLHEMAKDQQILVIEPRKLATINLAQRIRFEMQNPSIVEYVTSNESKFHSSSKIRFITDRVLLNEAINQFNFSKYYCIFVDEAHERNVNTDVLLGLLKTAVKSNPNMKIVVTSATLNQDLFKKYFDCSVFEVPGSLYPVNLKYLSSIDNYNNYSSEICRLLDRKIDKLNSRKPTKFDGNVLIFTAGIDEINRLTRELRRFSQYYNIVPLHGRLTPSEQQAVFKKSDERKIILATRIAETAITIENVTVVIDTGYDREVIYDPIKRMSLMEMTTISQSSATQRAGRAGRTAPGVCYRLFAEHEFQNFPTHKVPEIKRSNLDHIILKLKKFKISKVSEFDFIERPEEVALAEAIDTLKMLKCLDADEKITTLGDIVTTMPTDPTISRILYEAVQNEVEEEVARIVALVNNSSNLFYRGETEDKQHIADLKKFGFIDETGDLLTYLNVFLKYEEQLKSNHLRASDWARVNRINIKALNEALDTYKEIKPSLDKMKAISGKKVTVQKAEEMENLGSISEIDPQMEDENAIHDNMDDDFEVKSQENLKKDEKAIKLKVDGKTAKILKCFLIGFFQNICYYSGNPNLGYTLLRDMKNIKIHGASSLALQGKLNYQWVICTDISKAKYIHTKIVSAIDETWIEELIPKSFLEKFKIDDIKADPIYRSIILKDVSTSIIYNFIDGLSQRVQNMIDDHNIFFDGNRENLILEAWTTDPNTELVEKKIRAHIDDYKNIYAIETLERKFEGMTVSVIESGGKVREYLLRNETRQFSFKRDGCDSLEKYKRVFQDYDKLIESMVYNASTKSVKVKLFSKKSVAVIKNMKFKDTDKFNLLNSDCIAHKEVLSLVDVIWFIGRSIGTGFVKFHREEDAFSFRNGFNHTELLDEEEEEEKNEPRRRIQRQSIVCRIKPIRPQNVIFHNLPPTMDEFKLVKEIKARGYPGIILHTHIYRENDQDYYKIFDEGHDKMYETKLRQLIENSLESKDDLVKIEVAPKLSAGDFNEYKRKATLVFKNIHDAQMIKNKFDGKKGLIGNMRIYFLPAYHKQYSLRRDEYLPCRELYLAAVNEFSNRFGEGVKFENSFENIDFRKKCERKFKIRYNQDMPFVIIKIKSDHAFQMNEVVKKLNSFFLPKKFVLKAKDDFDILYDYQILENLKGNLKIAVSPCPREDCLKIFGDNNEYEKFCKKLLNYLENPSNKTETIKFRGKCITSLMINDLKNFNAIKADNKGVKINLSLVRREIIVSGKAQKVDKVISELNAHITEQRIGAMDARDCSICLAPVYKIFSLLGCGHKFCTSCLRNYALEAIDQIGPDHEFQGICCPNADCKKAIYLADLKSLLSFGFIDKLVKKVVQQSLYYFPNIKRCPTPDCPQIYADPEGSLDLHFECDVCSITYCKSCKQAYHPNKTCEEAKDERDMLDPLIRKTLGIKPCPKCKRPIQKRDGCDHMQCPCKNHFCWHCLKSYDDGSKCNAHVIRRHGTAIQVQLMGEAPATDSENENEQDEEDLEDEWFEA